MRSKALLAAGGFFAVGFAAAVVVSILWSLFASPGALDPPDTCRDVENPSLPISVLPGLDPVADPDVVLDPAREARAVCRDIDEYLALDLEEVPDGFLPTKAEQLALPRPNVPLVWSDDGCSFAPVRSGGPFGFLGACERHDFAWRNLRRLDREGVRVWNAVTKGRADLGFLHDMRVICADHNVVARPFCEASARSFYLAVHLYTPGTQGITDLVPPDPP